MCMFQDETLILTAADLGHQRVVEVLMRATTGIGEGDAEVCQIACVTIVNSSFALLVTDVTPL